MQYAQVLGKTEHVHQADGEVAETHHRGNQPDVAEQTGGDDQDRCGITQQNLPVRGERVH